MLAFWIPCLFGAFLGLFFTILLFWRVSRLPLYSQRNQFTIDKIVLYILASGFLAAVLSFWLGFLFLLQDMYSPITAIFGGICGNFLGTIIPMVYYVDKQQSIWEDDM